MNGPQHAGAQADGFGGQHGVGGSHQGVGRIGALQSITLVGSTPIGSPIVGWVCERFGARAGLVLGAAVGIGVVLSLLLQLNQEAIDLAVIGALSIKRATTIEFDDASQQWVVRSPDGAHLYQSPRRQQCLDWERGYFNNNTETRT